MLVERGVLVKVNSVMIPGVNDAHLKTVSQVVKDKGAFLHNVMPLIAEPEHGTFFGIMGQRGPTHEELQELQDACAGDMNMMRHCRQCRADAVGLLGEDRSADFTKEKVEAMDIDYAAALERRRQIHAQIEARRNAKASQSRETCVSLASIGNRKQGLRAVLMAVASSGGALINEHFGHAKEFLVYEASPGGVRFVGHRKVELYCTGYDTCGEAETRLARTIRALQGCEVVLCARIGYEPWGQLESAGIQPNGEHAMEDIEEAVAAVYQEMAEKGLLLGPDPADRAPAIA
jgi:nitrogen fixation protein NifB